MATEYLNNKTFELLIIQFQNCKKEKNKYQLLMNDCLDAEKRTIKRKDISQLTEKPLRQKNIEKEWIASVVEFEKVQDKLAAAFYILCENIVRYTKFNLIDQDDAIQDGVMICFEKIDRFDPVKGKAFNYCTTCTINTLRQTYRTARSYNEFKKKYLDFSQIQADQQISQSKTKSLYKKHNITTFE